MQPLSRLLVSCAFIASLTACGGFTSSDKSGKSMSSDRDEVLIRIAHVTESGGDNPGAEKLFRQAADRSGNAVEPRLELADFYLRHNGARQAIVVLQDAIKIQPENVAISRQLANAYINAGQPEAALPILDKAIASNGKDAFLYNSRGVALDMQARYSEAQQSYTTALLLSPQDAMTFNANLSMSYIVSGHYEQAIALLTPVVIMPDATPVIRQNLALAYGMNGQKDQALKLGMKDLSTKEAEENLKFYRMVASKPSNGKIARSESKTQVAPSVITSIFKDKEDSDEAYDETPAHQLSAPVAEKAAPVKKVAVTEKEIPLPAYKPAAGHAVVEAEEADDDEEEETAPIKTVRAKPIHPVSVMTDSNSSIPVPVLKPDRL